LSNAYLGDFKNTISGVAKRYHVTFINDHSRFTKDYMLNIKDKAEEMFVKYKAKVEN